MIRPEGLSERAIIQLIGPELAAAAERGVEAVQAKLAEQRAEQARVPDTPGPGRELPADVQAKMEGAFGQDFSEVRVHENEQAQSLGALAFTKGKDIVFAPGKYDPHTAGGRELIGHELAHVVQQREGRVRATGRGIPVNRDAALEGEAERQGARAASWVGGAALQTKPARSAPSSFAATALQCAFDKNVPSTYDDDGGHSYADHGAQTTAEQHKTRLTTGATPSGRNSLPPDGKSSKFASGAMHIQAMALAIADLNQNKKNRQGSWKRGHSNHYTLADCGITYELDNAGKLVEPPKKCSKFYCAWSNDGAGDNFKLITMWPYF